MRRMLVSLPRQWPSLLFCGLLTAIFASGFIAIDHLNGSPQQASVGSQQGPNERSALGPAPCGAQLGFAGYSVTLSTDTNATDKMAASLGLGESDHVAEFLPLTSSSPALSADPTAQALALDRMQAVHKVAFARLGQAGILAKLGQATDVAAAEPIWLQSSDKRYLSCDGKLRDNATDQALVSIAQQALVARGASAAKLDDSGTDELVSLRHFNGKLLLQVAFVNRPVGQPSVAYVAILDPGTHTVLDTVQANWYQWG